MFSPTASVRSSCRRWMETVPPLEDGLDLTATASSLRSGHNPSFYNFKRSVAIDSSALNSFASEITDSILANKSLEVTEWDADGWHYTGAHHFGGVAVAIECAVENKRKSEFKELMRMERVALYILAMDAINFCFWPLSGVGGVDGSIKEKNGLEYEHLAIALRKLAEMDDATDNIYVTNHPNIIAASSYELSPSKLAAMTPNKLQSLLQPHFPPSTSSQSYELPNIQRRCELLKELGDGLMRNHDGSALSMISKANRSADALVRIILDSFPGFRDYVDTSDIPNTTSGWETAKSSPTVIHFYKRAQIAVADIWAALGRCQPEFTPFADSESSYKQLHNCCHFTDMNAVTTFPDYRVPQILRNVGVMKYASSLAKAVDDQVELEKSGLDEISIRAATVVAVEDLVQKVKEKLGSMAVMDDSAINRSKLDKLSEDVSAVTIDWYLWQQGEKLDRQNLLEPHHRVRTTYY
mmetsp:Transcript_31733/g.65191  ORF Transcript_31733/g.65191 Transcript_31733/m.65191 type:complete len:468 (+) Transcript_31733:105-1508(+)